MTGEMAHVGGWEFDADTLQGTWTDEVARIHDLDPGQATHVELGLSFYRPESRQKIERAIKEALDLARPYDLELEIVSATGQHKWVRTMGLPLSEGSRVAKVRGIFQDITESKQAERELHIALEKYRVLFETFPLGISVTDAAGNLIEVNRESERLLGLSRQDHIRRAFDGPEWRIVHQDRTPMPPDEYASVRALQEKRLVENVEMGIVKSDGEITWINVTAAPIPLEGYGVVIAYGDITQRKRTEEALRESEERYRKLLELAPVAIAVHSDGKIVFINPAGVRLLGAASEEELIGRSVLDIIHPAGLNLVQERMTRLLAGEQGLYPAEDVYVRLDGAPINVEVTVTPLSYQGKPAFQAIVTDITERKRAAEALRENEAFIKAILDNLPIGVAVNSVDPAVIFNYMNDNFPKFYRTTRENLADPDGFWEAIYEEPKFREEMKQKVLADCASGDEERMIWVDIPITRQGADTHFITAKNIPVPGKPLMISTVWDVTERKRAEDELNRLNAELEQRVAERTAELTDLYNNAPCGYHSLDSDGVFRRINDTELALLGYTREEIIGRVKLTDLLTPAGEQIFKQYFPLLKERGWARDLEFDMVRKDGSILPVLLSASVIYDQAGNYLMSRSTLIDYTERRRAEAALRESQAQLVAANKELESFAYSVSHDLRAPLRGIDGWSLALLEDYGEELDEAARQYLDRVRSEAQRMGGLIDDLLQLSRVTRAEMHHGPVDLTALVHTVVTRLREMEPERRVEVVIQPGLTASGDAALLEIVLTNLLGNAFKFSSKCVEARVQFGCVSHASPPSPRGRGEGGEVYFVRDNGAGFDMAYASKLFGAFQRMHKASEFPGTGIGLAIVQRIIHRHGGQIWAEAEVGRGATFYFTLEADPKGLADL
ncbi:MAG: PAS domain S-box protein [Anaerolineales bacterium]|nr:PAS domain S-box protein [Anaerolineales bacterium]